MSSLSDADLLSHYICGREVESGDDPERINALKDSGYLSCVMDTETGAEVLRTTESGVFEVMMPNALGIDDLSGLRLGLERALGLWQ